MNQLLTATSVPRNKVVLDHYRRKASARSMLTLLLVIQLVCASSCFQPRSGPLQDQDLRNEINRSSFVGASIKVGAADEQIIVDDAATARKLLSTLIPIDTAEEHQQAMENVDYVFDFQSGRDPLWIDLIIEGNNDKLLYQIDGYVYRGGNAKEFQRIVKDTISDSEASLPLDDYHPPTDTPTPPNR